MRPPFIQVHFPIGLASADAGASQTEGRGVWAMDRGAARIQFFEPFPARSYGIRTLMVSVRSSEPSPVSAELG